MISDELDALEAEIEVMCTTLHKAGRNVAHYLWDAERFVATGNFMRLQDLFRRLEHELEKLP